MQAASSLAHPDPPIVNPSQQILIVGLCTVLACFGPAMADPVAQRADSSVIMDVEHARASGSSFVWDVDLSHPGTYVLQVVSTLEDGKEKFEGNFAVDGKGVGEALNKVYIIEDGMVSEFAEPYTFKAGGKHTVSVEVNTTVSYVRLVPQGYAKSRIFLSSKKYYDAWLKMHRSPEKVAAMEWYKQARFGMFIHWGVYSGAAGMWKGKKMEDGDGPRVAEWLMFTFKISRDEYREYAKSFDPDSSFAEKFAQLAVDAGMRYVVITSKHHDGFALFDSASSTLDIADASPYQGDLIKELYNSCRAKGLDFGVYYSHGNDWGEGGDGNYENVLARNDVYGVPTRPNGKNLWDPSPNTHLEYLEKKAYPQIEELIGLMPDLRLIWFDGDGLITEEQAFRFYKMVYDLNPNIVVNRRVGWDFGDYVDAGDNKTPSATELAAKHFETCGTANHSWGYKEYDHEWKTPHELLRKFVDIVSKGGNYLLNIGPTGEGVVPEPCVDGFLEVGEWVKANSDAIFGTRRWTTLNEVDGEKGKAINKGTEAKPNEFWFSANDNKVYAMSLDPDPGKVRIVSFATSAGAIGDVGILGSGQELDWRQTDDGLEIDLSGIEVSGNGYTIEVSFND